MHGYVLIAPLAIAGACYALQLPLRGEENYLELVIASNGPSAQSHEGSLRKLKRVKGIRNRYALFCVFALYLALFAFIG